MGGWLSGADGFLGGRKWRVKGFIGHLFVAVNKRWEPAFCNKVNVAGSGNYVRLRDDCTASVLRRWAERRDFGPLTFFTEVGRMTENTPKRPSKTRRIARDRLMQNLMITRYDTAVDAILREEVPDAWHTLEMDLDVEKPKEKITLYLDRSVARFYRGMGRGYHARINRILATWAQLKIGEFLQAEAALERQVLKRTGHDTEE